MDVSVTKSRSMSFNGAHTQIYTDLKKKIAETLLQPIFIRIWSKFQVIKKLQMIFLKRRYTAKKN